jgi:hypothetical protein
VSYLLHNHVDYAVELGLAGIPLPESRSQPEIYFFDILRQTNTIIFLVDKLFSGTREKYRVANISERFLGFGCREHDNTV